MVCLYVAPDLISFFSFFFFFHLLTCDELVSYERLICDATWLIPEAANRNPVWDCESSFVAGLP